jgi:glycosyltransferase involved in cell wall biosynthesis
MKILAAGMEWYEQIPGGLNQYFADYLKAMNHLGHSIEGLISGEGDHFRGPSYIQNVISEPDRLKLSTYTRIKSFHAGVKKRTALFQPDVFNPHFALYASMITRNVLPLHIPIVTHFHGPWAYESDVEDQGNILKKYVRYHVKKKIEQTTYHRSDAFIVLSQYFQSFLSTKFGIPLEKIHIVPGAADTDRFYPADDRIAVRKQLGIREDAQVLFCARRLVRRMGIDNLIRAMASIADKVPNVVLYIAGEGPIKSELEQLKETLNLNSSVHLLGRVSNEDLVRWYQAADLSIVPTVTLEGFGLVTTEALACGTPVLGTPYGGTKEILEKFSTELLFRDKTPEAIAEKIVAVLQGTCSIPSRLECRAHVLQHYTWENISKLLTRVYENAIEMRKEHKRYEGSLL